MERAKNILKGTAIAYILTIILIFTFSVLLEKTNIKEQYINTVIIVISSISILVGASASTIKLKKQGFINGLIISIIYMLGLYVISSILSGNFSINLNTIFMVLFGTILGIFGGIIGVNIK